MMANDEMTTPMLISMFGQIEMLPAGLFGKAIEGVTRAELRLCNADKVPLQVTFEMKDDTSMDQLMKQIKVGLAEGPGLFDLIEKEEITSEEAARPPFLGLLTFCRNALKEMDIERNGRVLRMTLGHVEGLKELPQNYLASLMVLAAMSGP